MLLNKWIKLTSSCPGFFLLLNSNFVAIQTNAQGNTYTNQSSEQCATIGFKRTPEFATGIKPRSVATADYDGDGKADIVVFRQGNWFLQQLIQGFTAFQFGAPADMPIPNASFR